MWATLVAGVARCGLIDLWYAFHNHTFINVGCTFAMANTIGQGWRLDWMNASGRQRGGRS